MKTKERKLSESERNLLNAVKETGNNSHDRALWIMKEFGYFDDSNNGRFTVHYSPSSTECSYIDIISKKVNFRRIGK